MSLLMRPGTRTHETTDRSGAAAPGREHGNPSDATGVDPDSALSTSGRAGPGRRHRMRLPHPLASGRFVLMVGAILAAGLVALLAVNTSLAAGSITLSGMETSLARQSERQQALETAVEGLASPAALQQAAVDLGMVEATSPAFLDPATGSLTGELIAATQPAKPRTQAPQVAQPEPTATPTPTATPRAGTLPPPAALPTPTPSPTPTVPADPGQDGATVPGAAVPAPGPPTPAVPQPAAPTGDGATLSDAGSGR